MLCVAGLVLLIAGGILGFIALIIFDNGPVTH